MYLFLYENSQKEFWMLGISKHDMTAVPLVVSNDIQSQVLATGKVPLDLWKFSNSTPLKHFQMLPLRGEFGNSMKGTTFGE